MSLILFDHLSRKLLPLTFTKAVASLRFGMWTAKERWENLSGQEVFVKTEAHLQGLYPQAPAGVHVWIDASVVPDDALAEEILALPAGSCIKDDKGLIAGRAEYSFAEFDALKFDVLFANVKKHGPVMRLQHPWQLMLWNDERIRADFRLATKDRHSQPVPASVNAIRPEGIFIEAGAKLSYCTVNASTGPVYIGRDAEIMEGCAIRGPLVMGAHSVLKMNSKVYGATTLGPYCMGGGEIKNAILSGYSNKAHDGYLGDSVVGEWCNFGAGSSNSNIKNTAGLIKVWDMGTGAYLPAGQKCGVIMGDYSRVAINASINTGSVIGISSNVFGEGLLPTIVPNFSWGVKGTRYELGKALNDIDNWKKLKQKSLLPEEAAVLEYIFAGL